MKREFILLIYPLLGGVKVSDHSDVPQAIAWLKKYDPKTISFHQIKPYS